MISNHSVYFSLVLLFLVQVSYCGVPKPLVQDRVICNATQYFNTSGKVCHSCPLCAKGYEHSISCGHDKGENVTCQRCSWGFFKPESGYGGCKRHKRCYGFAIAVQGTISTDVICSTNSCTTGYAFNSAEKGCLKCKFFMSPDCPKPVTPNRPNLVTTTTEMHPQVPFPNAEEDDFIPKTVVIIVGLACIGGISVIVCIAILRCCPYQSIDACCSFCRLLVMSLTRRNHEGGDKLSKAGGNDSCLYIPEYKISPKKKTSAVITSNIDSTNYGRQFSDTVAMLANVSPRRLLSASETVFGTTGGTDALLQLLSTKDDQEILYWKMELTCRLYTGVSLWQLSPMTRSEINDAMDSLPTYASCCLARALLKTFPGCTESNDLVCSKIFNGVVTSFPGTLLSDFLKVFYDNANDAAVERVCAHLFEAYKEDRYSGQTDDDAVFR